MDDEVDDSGFGGVAWYTLGRMSAENNRVRDQAVDTVLSSLRGRQRVDVDHLLGANQALAAENARLRQDLADYKHNYDRLHEWAQKASRDLKRYRGESS